MDDHKLRAWWFERQGLDGSLRGASPQSVLQRSGWSRSVGGVGPYLTLFSRAGLDRAAIDAAVARLEIHELPAARGCTYVVPKEDFGLALAVGREFGQADMQQARKLGVTDLEIEQLAAAVLEAVAQGPLDPEEIRRATGSAARSLGEAGKKKGLTTTLPLALGSLQARGDLRRMPVNGRLDQQRYKYVRWQPNPLRQRTNDGLEEFRELARRFFLWVGPATVAEFQWFAGLGVKATREILETLDLRPAAAGSERFLLAADLAEWTRFRQPAEPRYAAVSSLDPIVANRRDARSLLDAADARRPCFTGASTAGSSLADLPSHAILDRGRIVGLWEFDPDAGELAVALFVPRNAALDAELHRTETFVRDDLGDARSFSLDSPKSRAPRIAALRALR